MSEALRPSTADETRDAIQAAISQAAPLTVQAGGTKAGIGRPAQTEAVLDLSGQTGITLYEPEELVLSARSGTPLADIEAVLAEHRQELAFEPMDWSPLFGRSDGAATIGGVIASNSTGPRRIKAGAARDHFLGVTAVSGRGEVFKSGGRVMKNVTGYDLCKVVAGSWGTLGVMTDVTVKVLPRAETEATVVVHGLTDDAAANAMAAALSSTAEASAVAHLPEAAAKAMTSDTVSNAGFAATAVRLEGFGPSVDYRAEGLLALFAQYGPTERIDAEESSALWREIRDVKPFSSQTEAPLWRISATPTMGHAIVASIRHSAPASAFYDWGGGLIWLEMADGDARADPVRRAVAEHGDGHATLIRAPATARASTPVFHPQRGPLQALTKRLKDQFDPTGILNPGRMYAGV